MDKFLIELEMQLNEKHVALSASPTAREWLAQHGFDPLMGARPMARVIQDKIKRPLADELLFGKLVNGGRVNIDVRDGDLGRGEPVRAGTAVARHRLTTGHASPAEQGLAARTNAGCQPWPMPRCRSRLLQYEA